MVDMQKCTLHQSFFSCSFAGELQVNVVRVEGITKKNLHYYTTQQFLLVINDIKSIIYLIIHQIKDPFREIDCFFGRNSVVVFFPLPALEPLLNLPVMKTMCCRVPKRLPASE